MLELAIGSGVFGSGFAIGWLLNRKSVEPCNRSVLTLESRILVSVRRFQDLKVANDGLIAANPVESVPRAGQAADLVDRKLVVLE